MIIEGIGIVDPKPVIIAISDSVIKLLQDVARVRAEKNHYANSSSVWKVGMTENPILKGLIGECALNTFLQKHALKTSWNYSLLEGGDKGIDVMCNGVSIQVTTGVPWRRRLDVQKNLVPLACDIFVFASLVSYRCVSLDGWKFRDQMNHIGKIRPQGHINVESSAFEYEPMPRLVHYLKSYELYSLSRI